MCVLVWLVFDGIAYITVKYVHVYNVYITKQFVALARSTKEHTNRSLRILWPTNCCWAVSKHNKYKFIIPTNISCIESPVWLLIVLVCILNEYCSEENSILCGQRMRFENIFTVLRASRTVSQRKINGNEGRGVICCGMWVFWNGRMFILCSLKYCQKCCCVLLWFNLMRFGWSTSTETFYIEGWLQCECVTCNICYMLTLLVACSNFP